MRRTASGTTRRLPPLSGSPPDAVHRAPAPSPRAVPRIRRHPNSGVKNGANAPHPTSPGTDAARTIPASAPSAPVSCPRGTLSTVAPPRSWPTGPAPPTGTPTASAPDA
ncbi:hypothetical protein ABZY44_25385 [Streptomyces sp. NPDC006544]|uniref:hypothetical protein n=1 Tax=Streptomyces sp. NPDC006544 TaxID=3154583 RepID=UPI0033A508C1